MHLEVREVNLHDEVVAAHELLNGVQPLHLEVLISDVRNWHAKIDTSMHFVGTFLWDREEGALEAVSGLQR